MSERRSIQVDYLTRVEGEGRFDITIDGDRVSDVRLSIFEPPRFFEGFLQGRGHTEVPDITARICGICPVAYQMSSVHAIEKIANLQMTPELRRVRRLLYCGEWIESHALHAFMLHAPDFLGYQDAMAMAKDHPELVKLGLKLKKAGNAIVILFGGREIHPINVKVGGFYKLPTKERTRSLLEELKAARDGAYQALEQLGGLDFPELTMDYECVSLHHPDEYPMNEGRLISNKGLDIAIEDYPNHFYERHEPHSHALYSYRSNGNADQPYLVGPLARFVNNADRLPPAIQQAARSAGLTANCRNPFKSLLVRIVEILYACHEAIDILEHYETPPAPALDYGIQAGSGMACTEAPRGILLHRYELDAQGDVIQAQIIPPTSQNQKMIEEDLRLLVAENLSLDDESLRQRCEQAIRNYDPCISCATHFLHLNIKRRP